MEQENEKMWADIEALDLDDPPPPVLNEIHILQDLLNIWPNITAEIITTLIGPSMWAILTELEDNSSATMESFESAINAVYKNMQYPFGSIRKIECGFYHPENHLTHMALCECLNLEQNIGRSREWLMYSEDTNETYMEEAMNQLHEIIGSELYSYSHHEVIRKTPESVTALIETVKRIKAAWNTMYSKYMTAKHLIQDMFRGMKPVKLCETTTEKFVARKSGIAFGNSEVGWTRLTRMHDRTYEKKGSEWFLVKEEDFNQIFEILPC